MAGLWTRRGAAVLALAALSACGPQIPVAAPKASDLSAEVVRLSGKGPPAGPRGTCWAEENLPAVYETVTEQTLVTPEVRDKDGSVTVPATYRSVARLSVVRDRMNIWFKAPCPEVLTVDFIATLQRALKARGYYTLPLTGEMDQGTTEAVRRYQSERGLDSAQLSLAAAKQLGVITTALDEL